MDYSFPKFDKWVILFLLIQFPFCFGAPTGASSFEKWEIDLNKTKGFIEFKAIGNPSAFNIIGKGEGPKGLIKIEGSNFTGNLSFALDTLDTDIELRNEHMKKKYLETGKYPLALLTLTKLSLPSGDGEVKKVPFEGNLNLHGVNKPVKGIIGSMERKKGEIKVEAEFEINLSDFAISIPSFADITMAEKVEVKVEFSGPFSLK